MIRRISGLFLILAIAALGQPPRKPARHIFHIVSVCDVIQRAKKLRGELVAVSGKIDLQNGVLESCQACPSSIKSHGVAWINSLYLRIPNDDLMRQFRKVQLESSDKNKYVVIIGYIDTRDNLMATNKNGEFVGNGFGPFGIYPSQISAVGICFEIDLNDKKCSAGQIDMRGEGCFVSPADQPRK